MPNPYSYQTFAQLKTALAVHLSDVSKVFWIDSELGIYLNAAIREWNSIARMFRDRGTFSTTTVDTFYDLRSVLQNATFEFILQPVVTDDDLLVQAKYMLMEPNPTNQVDFTDGFTLADFTNAFNQKRNEFLLATGLVISGPIQQAVGAGDGKVVIADDTVIDVRRAQWNNTTPLFREDAFTSFAFSPSWPSDTGTPQRYVLYPDPLLNLQLIPPPADDGTLSLCTISSGTMLDDFTPTILWGALADLLSSPGAGNDPQRAAYCEQRYNEGVIIGKQVATILQAYVNGAPVSTQSVFDFDNFQPDWLTLGTPNCLGMLGSNLVAVAPAADDVYVVAVDAVRNAPQMVSDSDFVPFGKEYQDVIIDYAAHLAIFKQGGAEFQSTLPQYDAFVKAAVAYNNRMNAQNLSFETMIDKARAQEKELSLRPDETVTA